MQYYKPDGEFFVGDCMLFFHAGTFRLYYLLDEKHHQALGGLGGHQWAQASSTDLIHWQHHPLAIPITDEREGSICTGSVFFHQGTYYGFYATRMRDRTQHLSLATSPDGIHFGKAEPNPFASPPPGYDPLHYRDPVVFAGPGDGLFHMLVTACLLDPPIPGRGGCLAHLISADLRHWAIREPFILPGLPGVPECPDYFVWNGWYYLIFSHGGVAHYRLSRQPFGPWLRPRVDTLDGPAARVMKTAPFGKDRRIGAAWLGTRREGKDDGPFQFGGHVLLRELVQHEDGSLGARFPIEVVPAGEPLPHLGLLALGAGASAAGRQVRFAAGQGLAAAICPDVPHDARLVAHVSPRPGALDFGLRLRAGDRFDSGYDLHFAPQDGTVRLHDQRLCGVEKLDRPFTLEIVLWEDLIDVCIDGQRTLVDRCPERRGDKAFFYGLDSDVTFEVIEVARLPSRLVGTAD